MISNLITDRTQADVAYLRAQREKILNEGWAALSEAEQMEYLAGLKGGYNTTDLNRVTHAMEYLVERIRSYGYTVNYEKVKVPHQPQKGKSRLPDGYTELEYIESTGTQYIDTGFKPNNNTRVVMDADVTSNTTDWKALFSVRTNSTTGTFGIIWTSSQVYTPYYGSLSSLKFTGIAQTGRRIYDQNKEKTTIGGQTLSYTNTAFQCSYNLYLLALCTAGTPNWHISAKLYSCKMYDNGKLIRDYIPCKNPSNAVGLYDIANSVFYGNAGTGAFTAGGEVDNDKFYLTNMLSDGSFENVANNWNCWLAEPTDTSQVKDGTRSLKLGGDALAATQGTIPIIAGHTYYGREYIKTDGELTAADCRFEVIGGTDNGEHSFVFGWNRGNYPDWTAISSVITVDQTPASSYGLRTFTVGGSVPAWVDSIVLIDLTEAFGEGNEPDKEWCDEHIPFFADGYNIPFSEMFDDYTWYHSDIPQARELTAYLQNVKWLRDAMVLLPSTPEVPADMEGFTFTEANDIEKILVIIETVINLMVASFIYSGEIFSEEVI